MIFRGLGLKGTIAPRLEGVKPNPLIQGNEALYLDKNITKKPQMCGRNLPHYFDSGVESDDMQFVLRL